MILRSTDFKSVASAIPPPGQLIVHVCIMHSLSIKLSAFDAKIMQLVVALGFAHYNYRLTTTEASMAKKGDNG